MVDNKDPKKSSMQVVVCFLAWLHNQYSVVLLVLNSVADRVARTDAFSMFCTGNCEIEPRPRRQFYNTIFSVVFGFRNIEYAAIAHCALFSVFAADAAKAKAVTKTLKGGDWLRWRPHT